MNGAPRLTVAMIVRNESKTICRSLDSIQGIADQVVVFDSSDDDSTCEAAQGYDTEWIDAEWPDDFAAARNACLSHADGDWVLWLDSGETMSAADADSLREFVDTQADPNKLYMLLVATESTVENRRDVCIVVKHVDSGIAVGAK